MSQISSHKEACPPWASEKILQLRQLEIYLGNIPKTADWKSDHLQNLTPDISEKYQGINESTAEMVFRQICRQLSRESFTPESIAAFINQRIGYEGGPAYCSPSEVTDAINS